MSTPIENNTEELQAILQTVYNLPNAGGGGFSIPVIDLEELGFVGYAENLPDHTWEATIDDATLDQLKVKMDYGLIKLVTPAWDTKYLYTCVCGNYVGEDSTMIWCSAEYFGREVEVYFAIERNDYAGNKVTFRYVYKGE